MLGPIFIITILLVFLAVYQIGFANSDTKAPPQKRVSDPSAPKKEIKSAPDKNQIKLEEWKKRKTDDLLKYDSLTKLLKEKSKLEIGYNDLLNTIEWQTKRIKILVRDGYECQNPKCNNTGDSLHVHHKCYIKSEFPWEIDDKYLISLCRKCHKKEHDNNIIPVYEKGNDSRLKITENYSVYCSRCNGAGWFPQYSHVEEGICFLCSGDCILRTIFSEAIDNFKCTDQKKYEDSLITEIILFFENVNLSIYENSIRKIIADEDLASFLNNRVINKDDDLPF
jgi:hypothetical protein